MADAESFSNLLYGPTLDVLPLEGISVPGWEPVEHGLDQPSDFGPSIRLHEVVLLGRLDRFDRRPQLGLVVNEDDPVGVPPVGTQVVYHFAPADLTQPCEDRCLATEVLKFPHGLAQRGLDDLAGRLRVASQTGQRKTVQACEMAVEKRVEGALVAGEHPPNEFRLVRQLTIPIEAW